MKRYFFGLCSAVAFILSLVITGCSPSKNTRLNVASTDFAINNFKPIPVAERKQKLDPMQYRVTQEAATEPTICERLLGQPRTGYLCGRRVRQTAVQFTGQV